jgi:hypothetical protein
VVYIKIPLFLLRYHRHSLHLRRNYVTLQGHHLHPHPHPHPYPLLLLLLLLLLMLLLLLLGHHYQSLLLLRHQDNLLLAAEVASYPLLTAGLAAPLVQ